jgi:antitoxin component of MazEF toxin-antitoxin module
VDELFRLKIAGKRQVTLPQRLLTALQLTEGDEIQLQVVDGQIVKAEAWKAIPTHLFTPDILRQLNERSARYAKRRNSPLDIEAELKQTVQRVEQDVKAWVSGNLPVLEAEPVASRGDAVGATRRR